MTVTVLTIIIAVLVLAVALFVFRAVLGVRAYFKFRGKRLVTCPETHEFEAVDVAAGEAALGALLNEPTLRLTECSRWPERQTCGQDCLSQVDADPQSCLVWNKVAKWYEGKSCVFCRKPIGPLHRFDHAPALLGPDFKTSELAQSLFSSPLLLNAYARLALGRFPDLSPDVGPELFHHQRQRVVGVLRTPNFRRIRKGAVGRDVVQNARRSRGHVLALGVIAVGGDGRCRRTAHHFRVVEVILS
jgi:hypothetical protein